MTTRFRKAVIARWRTCPRRTGAALASGAVVLLVLSGLVTGYATVMHNKASPTNHHVEILVTPSTVIAGPYTGWSDSVLEGDQLGCVTTHVPVFPEANATTGKMLVSASTLASACGSTLPFSAVVAGFALYVAPFTGRTGTDHLVAHITSTFNVSLNVTGSRGLGAPPSFANYSITWVAAVYNESDQSTTGGVTSFAPYLTEQINSGSFSEAFKALKETAYCNATLNSGYTYEVAIGIELAVETSIGTAGATATASLNAATNGNGIKLASVSEP